MKSFLNLEKIPIHKISYVQERFPKFFVKKNHFSKKKYISLCEDFFLETIIMEFFFLENKYENTILFVKIKFEYNYF